jgi:hypothetical protein
MTIFQILAVDLLGVRLDMLEHVIEQLAAGNFLGSEISHLAVRLLAENLIAQFFGVLNVGGLGRFLPLDAVHPIENVPDVAALPKRPGAVMVRHGRRISRNRAKHRATKSEEPTGLLPIGSK